MKKESNDEEGWGIEGRCSSNRGHGRHSLAWQHGMLRDKTLGRGEKSNMEREEEKGEHGDDSDGDYRMTPPLFEVAKAGGSGVKSASVVESPAKTTRKRMSNILVVDSPAMATRGKKGQR
jgi:hypothetical protein